MRTGWPTFNSWWKTMWKRVLISPSTANGAAGKNAHTTALIVEGGAMRGAWAAGVLAFLHERGRRQFDLVYAASSGACSAAYFVADMWEHAMHIWRNLTYNVVRKT